MKKVIVAAIMLLAMSTTAQAQSVVREGNTFKCVTTKSVKADSLRTDFIYQDADGINYSIIVNKASGRCYVWKISSKTGKVYKLYMKESVSREICKELGITYTEKKTK